MKYVCRIVAAAFVALVASRDVAAGQSPAGVTQQLRIDLHGVAFDSLHNVPLSDALVSLLGTERRTTSDGRGRFQFDSVQPGVYTLAMQHAAFDSLGLSGATAHITVSATQHDVVISLPSFATLWQVACGGPAPVKDSGFVYGTIRDASGQRPVKGAVVDLTWLQIDVQKSLTVSQWAWRRRAQSDSTGSYAACGVPTDIGLQAIARADSDASGVIDLIPDGSKVRRLDLVVGPTAADSIRHGTIQGTITDPGGAPFRDAQIIVDEAMVVRTNDRGRFVMREVPAGTRQLEIRSVGMFPVMEAVNVTSGDTLVVNAQLRRVTTLDIVKVTASARARRYVTDFEDRKKHGFGYTRDSTAFAGMYSMSSVFAGFPSVQVDHRKGGSALDFMLTLPGHGVGRCVATLYIDGVKAFDFEELAFMRPDDIAAIEVYPREYTPPSRFIDVRSGCDSVIVWTKYAFS